MINKRKGNRIMKINKKLHSVALASAVLILFLIFVSSAASAANGTYKVVGTHYQYWSSEQYPVIDLFGEKRVPLLNDGNPIWKSHVNKLAKLVIDRDDKYIVKDGKTIDLVQGYSLQAKQIDVEGQKVWFILTKNGYYVDDNDNITVGSTWNVKLDDIKDEDDIVVFKVHLNQVFQGVTEGVAQIRGLWIIDYENTTTLKVGNKFKGYKLVKINNGVNKNNLGSLVFEVPVPVANFSASPTSGNLPLEVKFKDKSTGTPTSWKWSFGDGKTSTSKNPEHTYSEAGKYNVSLTVKNAVGSNTTTKKNYIKVTAVKPVANFSASPTSGNSPLKVKFKDKSTNATVWRWSFGDGEISTDQNPEHTYSEAGKYTVSLTVKNGVGRNTKTMDDYIKVKSTK